MVGDERNQDEPLLAELRSLFAKVDPVPPLVTEAARAALGWRRLDAELAELLSDSALEEESAALTRSAGAPVRSVTFATRELTVDIEIHADGEQRTLLGQLAPAAVATIEIQTVDDALLSVETDRLGRFRATLPAGGPIRLRVIDPARRSDAVIETSWISV